MDVKPRGIVEFTYRGRTIKGRFSTWAQQRYCDRMGITTIDEMFQSLTEGVSIKSISLYLLSAVEVEHEGEFSYTLKDACDWIDEMGGLAVVAKLISKASSVEDTETGAEKKTKRK